MPREHKLLLEKEMYWSVCHVDVPGNGKTSLAVERLVG